MPCCRASLLDWHIKKLLPICDFISVRSLGGCFCFFSRLHTINHKTKSGGAALPHTCRRVVLHSDREF